MGKKERILEQHPELGLSVIDIIMSADPSDNNRYTEFLIKAICKDTQNLKEGLCQALLTPPNLNLLNSYHNHFLNNRIKNTDISKYKTFKDVEKEVKLADEIVRLKELSKDVDVIFDSPEYLVILPHTHESMSIYGKATKWCVTQKQSWVYYRKTSRIIVIINKIKNIKYAVQFTWNNYYGTASNIQGWSQTDRAENALIWGLDGEIYSLIANFGKKSLVEQWVSRALKGYFGFPNSDDIEISKLPKVKYNNFLKSCDLVITHEQKIILDKMYEALGKDSYTNKKRREMSIVDDDDFLSEDIFSINESTSNYDDMPF